MCVCGVFGYETVCTCIDGYVCVVCMGVCVCGVFGYETVCTCINGYVCVVCLGVYVCVCLYVMPVCRQRVCIHCAVCVCLYVTPVCRQRLHCAVCVCVSVQCVCVCVCVCVCRQRVHCAHMDSLCVGLELWDKQLMLGTELDTWAAAKMAVFAQSHPFHSEEQVMEVKVATLSAPRDSVSLHTHTHSHTHTH